MYNYGQKDGQELMDNNLEIKLHALEIAELDRHLKN